CSRHATSREHARQPMISAFKRSSESVCMCASSLATCATLKLMAGKGEVDLFVRSYETLLRSTGEVRVAGLLEPYLAMEPTLHSRARDQRPDPAALTYVGLRLPPCMPRVRLVLLSTSIEAIQSRGYDLANWQPQTSPARRRRQLYDGGERVAILV